MRTTWPKSIGSTRHSGVPSQATSRGPYCRTLWRRPPFYQNEAAVIANRETPGRPVEIRSDFVLSGRFSGECVSAGARASCVEPLAILIVWRAFGNQSNPVLLVPGEVREGHGNGHVDLI